jgi:hypothetical protein
MLFTPKKHGRDWYWFHMMALYGFSILSGGAAIWAMLSSDIDLSERIVTALGFSLVALIMWALGRRCSTIVAQLGANDRRR